MLTQKITSSTKGEWRIAHHEKDAAPGDVENAVHRECHEQELALLQRSGGP